MNNSENMNLSSAKHILFFALFIFGIQNSVSQIKRVKKVQSDTLKTESVTIIKTYNPTIDDASKIKVKPNLNNTESTKKKTLQFQIKSVPVASTFVPKKAKSIAVKKERRKLPPQNYASLGGGNFGNAEAEVFYAKKINRDAQFSALLEHQSSQGGIKNVRVNDFYYDTDVQLNYRKQNKKNPWQLHLQAQHQFYNWYGIPEGLTLSPTEIENIDPSHNFIDVNLGSSITFDNPIFKNLSATTRFFFDDYNSQEFNFIAQPKLNFEIQDYRVDLPIELDYVNGKFSDNSLLIQSDYQIANLGVKPSINLSYYGIDFKLGLASFLSYTAANYSTNETDFFIYPNVLASYRLPNGAQLYGGITGDLHQNTYHNAVESNIFVAPQLFLAPTNEQFNVFGGLQGSVSTQLSYGLKAAYKNEQNKPLFIKSGNILTNTASANYGVSNSFVYAFADINTTQFSGNLAYKKENDFQISLDASVYSYNVSKQPEAWNLPQFEVTLYGNYTFAKKWAIDTSIFGIGSRKDLNPLTNTVTDLKTIIDFNLGLRYDINKNWQAFAKGYNITNQNYQFWLDYPVQSAQGLIGIKYLF